MATPIPSNEPENQNPTPPPATPASQRTYTESDLERVRQQEKAKLYAELEKLREQTSNLPTMAEELEALRKEREEREASAAEEKARAEEAERVRSEAEMSAKDLLEKRNAEWEERIAELQKEREAERAVLEQERKFAQLREYTQQRVQQESENIAPELLDLVDGNTPEEVDASIERLKAKSSAIAEKVRETQQSRASQQQGVSANGFSTTGPMDMLPTSQTYTAEEIQAMTPKEFAEKVRPHFIGQGSASRNRGMYG
ncbi:hypothetical protein [Streptomyces tubercidicus]|uniref:hypothetical protein n=1 Tax=Streptomyces tubercidicus TaxID=47759 RepID=UPI0036C388C1